MASMKIYKYEIECGGQSTIPLPKSRRVIHAGLDPSNHPCLWAEVGPDFNPNAETRDLTVEVVMTGREVPDYSLKHRGSFVHIGLMLHVYTSD